MTVGELRKLLKDLDDDESVVLIDGEPLTGVRQTTISEDPVNHPKHYTQGDIEVIDAIEDWELDYHDGNAVKYIARAKHKGNYKQDLEKAVWYLKRKLELIGED